MKINIYKIYNDDMSYIGSSKNFKKRILDHKSDCYNENCKAYNYFIYQYIRQHGGWDEFTKEIIHTCEVKDKTEQRMVEQEFINKNECKLNDIKSYQTKEERKEQIKQWKEKNKDHNKELRKKWKEKNKDYCKQWEEKNKEKRRQQKSQKVNCPNCNKEMRKDSLSKHLKNVCKPK